MEPLDNKKKAIIAAVGIGMVSLLGTLIYFITKEEEADPKTALEIDLPKVDEKKIDTISKLEAYDEINVDSLEKAQAQNAYLMDEEESMSSMNGYDDPMGYGSGSAYGSSSRGGSSRNVSNESSDKELKMLMELQRQMQQDAARNSSAGSGSRAYRSSSSYGGGSYGGGSYGGGSYGGGSSSYGGNPYAASGNASTGAVSKGNDVTQETQQEEGRSNSSGRSKNTTTSYFYGAEKDQNDENVFIPAETIERSLLLDQAIIPIRIKKTVSYNNLVIPANSVLYGRIIFEGLNRLKLVVKSYKLNNKMYPVDFKIYDYDGMEGLNLRHRSWTQIPKKVTEDMFRYAYQKGTQSATFGSDNRINKEELKMIGAMSAANEVAKEIFEKRRILLPEKYQLWIVL